MDRPRMRPVFVLPHPAPVRALQRVGALLEAGHVTCTGTVFRRHAVLHMKPGVRHFFSPYLYLEAELPDEEDELAPAAPRLRGRFAPHPNVWTLFMAIYGVLAMGGFVGAMFGISQWWLGWTPWALAAVPASAAVIAFVYGAAFIGQGLGAQQMYELRALLDRALGDARDDGPPRSRAG